MSDLRTAAQQALAFTMRDFASLRDFEAAKAVLHDNLRAALAQQDEPVAGRAFLERILAAMEGVIDVADRKTDEFDALRSCVIDLTLMLHTAPPQRKLVPLTEAEIEHIGITHQSLRQVARAVERAVWEKNHG